MLGLAELQRLFPVRAGKYRTVHLFLQERGEAFPDILLVIYHEYGRFFHSFTILLIGVVCKKKSCGYGTTVV